MLNIKMKYTLRALLFKILFFPLLGTTLFPEEAISSENFNKDQSSVDWEEITTVEDLYSAYPERLELIFSNLDLQKDGLEDVKQAWQAGDYVMAGKYLLDYYNNSEIRSVVADEVPEVSARTVSAADSIVHDIITIQRVSDQVPRLENGHLDWHHTGPEDDLEYAWLHNRHSTVSILLDAWFETGNPKYAKHIDHYIKDWIISSWPYPEVRSSTAMWRGLEVTARVRNWMPAFYNLIGTEYLSPATQLLILSSLPEHTHYLRNFHASGNWLTMEMNGLATVATHWPEFAASEDWLDYTIEIMTSSMREQVYPDGVQTELTSHYHRVALSNFERFNKVAGMTNVSLPDFYVQTLEDMWEYLAVTMRPDGYGVLNNNSDKTYNREIIKEAASAYNREDWSYIASNGSFGSRPDTGPSFVYPWAGQIISRSDYGPDAHWSYFDIGPWGTGHQHNDKLHLSVAAFGRDLLVDGGRFAYRGSVADRFREYALSSHSHNLILIDGKGQGPGPRLAEEPIPEKKFRITDEFDYASASVDHFDDLEGEAVHSRSLFYIRGQFWVVIDRITSDRPREIEVLWHWHPDTSVRETGPGVVSSTNQRGNLKILSAGNPDWNIDFVKGQEDPVVQGWYSKEYNMYEPNTATIYSCHSNSGSTFVWVLFPFENDPPEVNAEITEQDINAVKVRVTVADYGFWDVNVPFMNSSQAAMEFTPE